eukprot:gene2753-3384_t
MRHGPPGAGPVPGQQQAPRARADGPAAGRWPQDSPPSVCPPWSGPRPRLFASGNVNAANTSTSGLPSPILTSQALQLSPSSLALALRSGPCQHVHCSPDTGTTADNPKPLAPLSPRPEPQCPASLKQWLTEEQARFEQENAAQDKAQHRRQQTADKLSQLEEAIREGQVELALQDLEYEALRNEVDAMRTALEGEDREEGSNKRDGMASAL